MEEVLNKKLDLVEKMVEKNPQADYLKILLEEPIHRKHSAISKSYLLSIFLFPYGFILFCKLFFLEDEKFEAIVCLIISLLLGIILIQGLNDIFPTIHQATSSQVSPVNTLGL